MGMEPPTSFFAEIQTKKTNCTITDSYKIYGSRGGSFYNAKPSTARSGTRVKRNRANLCTESGTDVASQLSKQAISVFARQKQLSTSRRENMEQAREKQFQKDMVERRKTLVNGVMPRTVFDFKMDSMMQQ